MKEIKLLRRAFVEKVGVCEKDSKTKCSDETAAHLVKSKLAEYAGKEDAAAAKKEAAAAEKAAE
ncbi:MAG: hypothetical protein JKY93_12525 [Gammaproteobacteria bacterium]|nr:hypothetical protein [Gammaproteobacteria bacterium]